MTDAADQSARDIAHNVAVHDKVATKYDLLHGEIFNVVEQQRLRNALAIALEAVRTGSHPIEALDFGCGSGNLSRHLLKLGARVTAADVSRGFLDLVRARYQSDRLTTYWMENGDMSGVPEGSFDFISTYSVLHHIPDYIAAVGEMARMCRPGGVIFIDHEASENSWSPDPIYQEFRGAALRFDWGKYLIPSNYLHRVKRLFKPRHSNEGDIHVWPDDHIEWSKITATLAELGFEVIAAQDYLLNRRLYRPEVYEFYRDQCSDTSMMVFRKCAA